MLRLIMVRHGRTAWNVQGRVQGGGGLDAIGRAQADALAERLAAEPIAAVYSSPAWRARQTAGVVARDAGLPVRRRAALKDLDYGRYAGALVADVMREDPELFRRWRDAPETVTFENGENLANLRERIARFFDAALAAHPDATVLAASHDSPIRMAASIALGLPDSAHRDPSIKTAYAAVNLFEIDGAGVRLRLHNDAGHLASIDDTA